MTLVAGEHVPSSWMEADKENKIELNKSCLGMVEKMDLRWKGDFQEIKVNNEHNGFACSGLTGLRGSSATLRKLRK